MPENPSTEPIVNGVPLVKPQLLLLEPASVPTLIAEVDRTGRCQVQVVGGNWLTQPTAICLRRRPARARWIQPVAIRAA